MPVAKLSHSSHVGNDGGKRPTGTEIGPLYFFRAGLAAEAHFHFSYYLNLLSLQINKKEWQSKSKKEKAMPNKGRLVINLSREFARRSNIFRMAWPGPVLTVL